MNAIASAVRRRGAAAAFTLAEVLICALLLALGFIALVAAFGHDSVMAQRGEEVTAGTFLADAVRDLAFQLEFAQVLALDGATCSPAYLSAGQTGWDLSNWSQHIAVTPVSSADLNTAVAPGSADAARVTVQVRCRGVHVVTQTYYVFNMTGVPFTDAGG